MCQAPVCDAFSVVTTADAGREFEKAGVANDRPTADLVVRDGTKAPVRSNVSASFIEYEFCADHVVVYQ
jgi:hypothetical protein